MIKSEEISNPDSCLNKAGDEEPVFVLRAHDRTAPFTVRFWITQARGRGAPEAKLKEAQEIVDEMEAWQAANGAKVPD